MERVRRGEAAFRREPPQRAVRKDWVMAIATDDRDGALTIEAQRALSIEVDSRKPEQFGRQISRVLSGFNGRRDRSARRERVQKGESVHDL